MILKNRDRKEIIQYLRDKIQNIRKYSWYDIGIPTGIQRPLKDYKNIPIHIRAIQYSNKYLGTDFREGSKPYWCYVKVLKELPKTDVIAYDEHTKIPSNIIPDWNKIIDIEIKSKVEDILKVVDISWSEIEGYTRLDTYFIGHNMSYK